MIDRSELNRLLAQALAYNACGKADKANEAARQLIAKLAQAGIL